MFLKRVYKEWRLLFWCLLLLMAAQFFFMAKGIENVPFFLYHMFSKDHQPVDSTAVYLVKTRDGYLNHKQLSNREDEMLMNSVAYYCRLKQNGDGTAESVKDRFKNKVPASVYDYMDKHLVNDSISMSAFPKWWGAYLSSVIKNDYDVVALVRSFVYTKPPYNKSVSDSVIFYVNLK